MNDRELLELAAKAAGVKIVPCTCSYEEWPFKYADGQGRRGHWNPLVNDGDALRLATKLRISLHWCSTGRVYAYADGDTEEIESTREDPDSSVRSAIVRAAAEIGEAMQ